MKIALPPTPPRAAQALVAGHSMQGPELRLLADAYEPNSAQHSLGQLQAFAIAAVEADRASRVPMTAAKLITIWCQREINIDFDLARQLVGYARLIEAHHGIVGVQA